MHYLVEEETTEGLAAADPFEGHGVFLAMAAGAQEILGELERVFGRPVPAVACPGSGAWADVRRAEMTKDRVVAMWEGAHA